MTETKTFLPRDITQWTVENWRNFLTIVTALGELDSEFARAEENAVWILACLEKRGMLL